MTDEPIRPRWDGDTRGKGTSSAGRPMVDEVIRLEVAARRLDWVAEDPDAHLLPRLQEACTELPGWSVASVAAEGPTYVVTLEAPPGVSRPQARPAIYRLLAEVAEPVTFVREKTEGQFHQFDVLLGHLEGDTLFAPHGHVLRLLVPASADS